MSFSKGNTPWNKGRKMPPLTAEQRARYLLAVQTAEHKAKISAANTGRQFTAEHRAKLGAASKARRRTAEERVKRSLALRGKVGERSIGWKGGRIINQEGYVHIYSRGHPHANAWGYVLEHRLVVEAHLGRTLLPHEIVHHINGVKDDNRVENLMLFSSNAEHLKNHKGKRGIRSDK